MKKTAAVLIALVGLGLGNCPALAQTAASAAATASATYSTAETVIGTLLEDAAAKAIVEKYLPGFSANPNIELARAMSLKAVQQYAPDKISDEALANIDAEFVKLAATK
jgi:voltage-gated potassium channel Kch